MIVPNHLKNYFIYKTYFIIIIIEICGLIEKLCPTINILIQNLKIMNKVSVNIGFINNDTLK